MADSLYLQDAAWIITTVLELVLLVQLVRKKAVSNYPFFTAYLASAILQSAAVATIYRTTDVRQTTAWLAAWGTQAVVTIMRSLALVALARRVLSAYRGIWGLAKHLLVAVGLGVLFFVLLFSKGQWDWVIMDGVRGFELASAAVIVTMLLFARFYRLPLHLMPRALAIGFCLYSSFYVIDYSLLEKVVQQYSVFWNFLGIVTFLASLVVWIRAANLYVAAQDVVKPAIIPPELYGKLSSEVNLRLHLLNRQLVRLLHTEERRP